MAQKDDILLHLKSGKALTQLEALKKFGCMRLASVIHVLKNEGHKINMQMVYNAITDKRYASYWM